MRQNKVYQFSAPGSETPSIPLKNPERIGGGGGRRGSSQEHEAVVRVQREKTQSSRKKDKRFESEGGVQVLL